MIQSAVTLYIYRAAGSSSVRIHVRLHCGIHIGPYTNRDVILDVKQRIHMPFPCTCMVPFIWALLSQCINTTDKYNCTTPVGVRLLSVSLLLPTETIRKARHVALILQLN